MQRKLNRRWIWSWGFIEGNLEVTKRFASVVYPSFQEVPCVVNSTNSTRPPTASAAQSQSKENMRHLKISSESCEEKFTNNYFRFYFWMALRQQRGEHTKRAGMLEQNTSFRQETDSSYCSWSRLTHAIINPELTLAESVTWHLKNAVPPPQPTQSISIDTKTWLWVLLWNRGTRKCPRAAHYSLLHTRRKACVYALWVNTCMCAARNAHTYGCI